MGSGATSSGDDMVVGRTNVSDVRTILVASTPEDGYAEDFVFFVGAKDDKVLRTVADGVDAVHANGTVEFPTGGAIGVMPAGNGVVGTGLNGIVGYVRAAPRDKSEEKAVKAGVLGVGSGASPGVFGRSNNGVVGYTTGTARDPGWESRPRAGVSGRSDGIGVRGKGSEGGVQGLSPQSFGVQGEGNPGVHARGIDSGAGTITQGEDGPGVIATSVKQNAAVFEASEKPQVWLVPRKAAQPTGQVVAITPNGFNLIDGENRNPLSKNGRAGELAALVDGQGQVTLWFCVSESPPSRWAQMLLGPTFAGTAS
uniref:hypothetical protein n=1 Tax=Streptomyces sp. NBC_01001 TaxID=2903713 RepID=UPI002F90A92D|nr:hypothetical protein OG296_37040 [Streptomyces sp. NBC_01001]